MALKGIQPARRRLADEVYEQLMYAIMNTLLSGYLQSKENGSMNLVRAKKSGSLRNNRVHAIDKLSRECLAIKVDRKLKLYERN